MDGIVIRLDLERLADPDPELRYRLPELLAERSGKIILDDGYGYASDSGALLVFLRTDSLEAALACILDVIADVRVLGNDLRPGAVVAVARSGGYDVVYPADFQGLFAI